MNLTLQDWITSSNAFPDRAHSPDLTDEVKKNATILINKVNNFLDELGYTNPIELSSGFRPLIVNAHTPGSAKKSGHCLGFALDIKDNHNQDLCKLVESRPDLLRKYALFMENKSCTIGKHSNWCHIDFLFRADRPSRTFLA